MNEETTGWNPDKRYLSDFPEIFDAIEKNDVKRIHRILDEDPSMVNVKTYSFCPVHIAATQDSPELVELMIARGAPVNMRDKDGRTPLHWAAEEPYSAPTIEVLLKHGAEMEVKDVSGKTPLDLTWTGREPGGRDSADLLIRHGAVVGVESAVRLGKPEHLGKLLAKNPQLLQEGDRRRRLPFEAVYAIQRYHLDRYIMSDFSDKTLKLLTPEYRETLDLLFDHGAEIDAEHNGWYSLLYVAAECETDELVRYLLEHGADPTPRPDNQGRTPLDVARAAGNHGAVKLLREYREKGKQTP